MTPTNDHLATVAQEAFGQDLQSARRFATRFCHYVYDIVLTNGQSAVIRVAEPTNTYLLEGAVHWSNVLRPLGVPLLELLHAQLTPDDVPLSLHGIRTATRPRLGWRLLATLAAILFRLQQPPKWLTSLFDTIQNGQLESDIETIRSVVPKFMSS